jgi:hypothetical protein
VIALLLQGGPAFAGYIDTFDSISPDWVTSRTEPHAFVSSFFDGDNRLKVEVNVAEGFQNRPNEQGGRQEQSTFYNTQGRERHVSQAPPWRVSGELYVDSDMVSGANLLRRTDLWCRTGVEGTEAGSCYAIIGIRRYDPDNMQNPDAFNITSSWRIWDDDIGWIDVSAPVTTGWHTLDILGDGTSFDFRIDGTSVYVDSTINPSLPDLTSSYVLVYNFGDETHPSTQNYTVYWDNVEVTPEPATMTLLVLGGGALALIRARRRK